MTKHVRRHCLQRHESIVGSDVGYVGYVGFHFIQIAWLIVVGIVFNIAL
jgi:hypothetical protein